MSISSDKIDTPKMPYTGSSNSFANSAQEITSLRYVVHENPYMDKLSVSFHWFPCPSSMDTHIFHCVNFIAIALAMRSNVASINLALSFLLPTLLLIIFPEFSCVLILDRIGFSIIFM